MAQQGGDSFISGGAARGRPTTSELAGYGSFVAPRRAHSQRGAATAAAPTGSGSGGGGGGGGGIGGGLGARAPMPPRGAQPPLPSEGLGVVAASGSIAGAVVGTGMGSSSQLPTAVPRAAQSRLPVKLPSVDPLAVSAVLTKIGLTAKAPRSASAPRGVPETLVRGRPPAAGELRARPLCPRAPHPLPTHYFLPISLLPTPTPRSAPRS